MFHELKSTIILVGSAVCMGQLAAKSRDKKPQELFALGSPILTIYNLALSLTVTLILKSTASSTPADDAR